MNTLIHSGIGTSFGREISLNLERDRFTKRLCSAHGNPKSLNLGTATWIKIDYIWSNVSNLDVQPYLVADDSTFYVDTSNYVGENTGYQYVDAIETTHIHHHIHDGVIICSRYQYSIINN